MHIASRGSSRRYSGVVKAGYAAGVTPLIFFFTAALLAFALGGCGGQIDAGSAATTLTEQDPNDVKYNPSDEPYRMGVEHFNRGHYGLAEQYFRDAAEKSPQDASAWIGLASSYDRLLRFDLADRAYERAIALEGESVRILNNRGYSFMLRGRLVSARGKFLAANERDPNNEIVRNNIKLLDASLRYTPPVINGEQ